MLDTSTCVLFMNRANARVAARISRCDPADVFVSTITLAELSFGVEHSSQRALNMEKLIMFRSRVQGVPFDESASTQFGLVHADLTRRGCRMGPFDTLIAGHALSLNLTLVTDNVR